MAAIRNRWQQSSLLSGFLIFGLVHKIHCKTIREVRDINSIASFIRSAQDAPSEQHLYRKNKRRDIRERHLVVGGSAAPPGRFPYAVSLQSERVLDSSESENNEQVVDSPVCGGTLIASDVVLTAGHCGYNERSSSSSSYVNFGDAPTQIFDGADVGAYDLNENYGGEGYTVDNMLFEKLIIHPEFTGYGHSSTTVGVNNGGSALQHDVMLVKLYGASDNPTVRIHNPNVDAQPTEGEEMVVIGFGDTNPLPGEVNSVMSTVLRAASVAYVPNDLCDNAKGYSNIQSGTGSFEDYFEYDGTITSDMICGLGDNSQDACQGDSGGGLLRLGSTYDQDLQLGIVSWGLQCGDEDFPGVYARVAPHYDWIQQTVCEIADNPPAYFGCPIKPLPPGDVDDPIVNIVVSFRLDDYRTETGWVLESIPDFRNIRYRPFGTYKAKSTVDAYNSFSEPISVQSGRFYMLSVLDEFADGFCCAVGEGYFRVDYADRNGVSNGMSIVESTPGILWTPHALRRAFYVSSPGTNAKPTDYVTIVITLGMGADPGKLLLVALENMEYEALMLYEIRPFLDFSFDSSRFSSSSGEVIYTQTFVVPVFGAEFNRQRYNIIVVDDNDADIPKTSFEVYLGPVHPKNLVLSQTGDYGDPEGNNISRTFALFKKAADSSSLENEILSNSRGNAVNGARAAVQSPELNLFGLLLLTRILL